MATTKKTTKAKKTLRPVLVTTEHRGVFFGRTKAHPAATTVALEGARNCLYWTSKTGGFLGLAERGPVDAVASGNGSRIGARASGTLTLQGVTSVTEVTEAAAAVWESAPCYGG